MQYNAIKISIYIDAALPGFGEQIKICQEGSPKILQILPVYVTSTDVSGVGWNAKMGPFIQCTQIKVYVTLSTPMVPTKPTKQVSIFVFECVYVCVWWEGCVRVFVGG